MLSTLRVASRSAVAREANMRTVVIGARQASAWSKVPQGPPVSLEIYRFARAATSLGSMLMWSIC
jgi:hypothetical protein